MSTHNQYSDELYKEVISLHKTGMRVARIAKTLKIPRSTVNGWIYYGRNKSGKSGKFRKSYSDQDIIDAANSSNSMAQMLKKLGLKPAGGNYDQMKRKLKILNLTCEHWGGQAWSKDEQLKDWASYKRNAFLKKHLMSLRNNQCEICKISDWQGKEISLELHHLDGNRVNNKIDNLQILCPNCHSQTSNFRVPKKDKTKKARRGLKCKDCNVSIWYGSTRCRKCEGIQRLSTTKIVWPTDEELGKLVWEIPTSVLAKRIGVSDQAITSRCRKRKIPKPARGYWSKLKTCQS